jgi:hypothetical protein
VAVLVTFLLGVFSGVLCCFHRRRGVAVVISNPVRNCTSASSHRFQNELSTLSREAVTPLVSPSLFVLEPLLFRQLAKKLAAYCAIIPPARAPAASIHIHKQDRSYLHT